MVKETFGVPRLRPHSFSVAGLGLWLNFVAPTLAVPSQKHRCFWLV